MSVNISKDKTLPFSQNNNRFWFLHSSCSWLLPILLLERWGLVVSQPTRYFTSHIRVASSEFVSIPILDITAATIFFGAAFWVIASLVSKKVELSWKRIAAAHCISFLIYALILAWKNEIAEKQLAIAWLVGLIPKDEFLAVQIVQFMDYPWPFIAFLISFCAILFLRRNTTISLWLLPLTWLICFLTGPALYPTTSLSAVFRLLVMLVGVMTALLLKPGHLPWLWQIAPTLLMFLPWVMGVFSKREIIVWGFVALLNLGIMLIATLLVYNSSNSLRSKIFFADCSWFVPFFTLATAGFLPSSLTGMIRLMTGVMAFPALVLPELVLIWFLWMLFNLLFLSDSRICIGRNICSKTILFQSIFGILASLYAIIILFDTRIFGILGIRLNVKLLNFAGQLDIAFNSIKPYLTLPTVAFFLIVLLLGQRDAHYARPPSLKFRGLYTALLGAGCGFVIVLMCINPVLVEFFTPTLWNLGSSVINDFIEKMDFSFKPDELIAEQAKLIPFPEQVVETASPTFHNLVLVIAESMHTRYLSLYGSSYLTQPRLASYSSRIRLFTHIHCNFPSSENANFAILNALYPTEESIGDLNPTLSCPSLLSVLKDYGYHVSYYYPGDRRYRNFDKWLKMQKPETYYDQMNMPDKEKWITGGWGIDERCVVKNILTRCTVHKAQNENFAIIYTTIAPHHPFPLFDSSCLLFTATFADAVAGLDIRARYLNQLVFMDKVFAELLEGLQNLDLLDSTLVVFVADHGEALGENNIVGHGFRATPDLTNIFCAFMEPGRKSLIRDSTLGSQVDIMPTILDELNIPMPVGHLYQGRSLLASGTERPILISSLSDRAVVTSKKYYRLPEIGPGEFFTPNLSDGPTDFSLASQPLDAEWTAQKRLEVLEFEKRQRVLLYKYEVIQPKLYLHFNAGL